MPTRSHLLALAARRMSADVLPIVDGAARLRLPFPPAQIGHLPRAGITLEYVGHGAVTSRLLDVDPEWTWEPCSFGEDGQPVMQYDGNGNPVGLWIKLTVLGVTRFGFGSCTGSQFEAEKVLIGDAIRNAAMRFGVALDLWIKGHAEDDEKVAASDDRQRPARGKPSALASTPCALCNKPLNDGSGDSIVKGATGQVHRKCLDEDEKNAVAVGPGSSSQTAELPV